MGKARRQRVNYYAGFPGAGKLPAKAERVAIAGLTPTKFWQEYICTRKPVVIAGHLKDAAWKASELWTDDYLTQHAGDVVLEVEERESQAEGYGKGTPKLRMSFGECLRRMASGDTSLYLTTQKVAAGEDGHPEVLSPPLSELASDFPVQPSLLGNLVPQQINLWAGCAPDGSSTGLHMDYHCNLYVLLRGRKRFRLYPPSAAERMYVRGELAKIWPNGRIVFKSQGDVLADGSDAKDVALWEARRAAEAELRAAEEAVAAGEKGAEARLAAAEDALDKALEAALDEEAGDGWDDFDALDEDDEEGVEGAAAENKPADTGAATDPDSFSRVDLSRPASELRKEFPLFPGASAAMECEVAAGEMLYVPAGWFHEVTSYSTPGSSTHMALNYWCHPPDNLALASGFQQPYKSGYWPDVWEGRKHKYAPAPGAVEAGVEQEGAAAAAAAGPSAAAGSAPAGSRVAHQLQAEQRGQKRSREGEEGGTAAAAGQAGPPGNVARLLQGFYGLFGFGRRQFLHRFVGLRVRRQPQQQ